MASLYEVVRLHVPGTPYAARINRIIAAFETLYGSFLYLPVPSDVRSAQRTEEVILPGIIGYRLSGDWIPRPSGGLQALIVKSIDPAGSVNASFSGLGDAIEAAAEICDRSRRRQRAEVLRHDKEMNLLAEEQARLDVELKSLDLIQRQIDMINAMIQQGLVEESAGRLKIQEIMGVQDSAGEFIESEGAEVIDVREDEMRQIED